MMSKINNPFDTFMDTMVAELIAMPDEQVLDGLNPGAIQAEGLGLLKAAKATAGQRRLAAAKVGVTSRKELPSEKSPVTVSLDEARRYLARAANDSRYTLAARGLGELSDEEVLRLYNQIKSLESTNGGESST